MSAPERDVCPSCGCPLEIVEPVDRELLLCPGPGCGRKIFGAGADAAAQPVDAGLRFVAVRGRWISELYADGELLLSGNSDELERFAAALNERQPDVEGLPAAVRELLQTSVGYSFAPGPAMRAQPVRLKGRGE